MRTACVKALEKIRRSKARLTGVEEKLTAIQLAGLRKKLSLMSVTVVMDAYRSAYFQCKLGGDKTPSALAIQTLVQAWEEMRG
jgi:hypothetical protein